MTLTDSFKHRPIFKHRFHTLLLCLALVCSLASCREEVPPDSSIPYDSPMRSIAMVANPGSQSDLSFSTQIWESIQSFAKAHELKCTLYKTSFTTQENRVETIERAIAEGADTVVLPGFLFARIMMTLPYQYPEVKFIALDVDPDTLMDGEVPAPNLICIAFSEEESGYLAGYAAVMDGYTQLGFLGGMPIPSVVRFGKGFLQGADAAALEMNTQIQVCYDYAGRFTGSPEVTGIADAWYRDGTQVIFACGGELWTSPAQAAMDYSGKLIGVDVDQHPMAEDKELYEFNPFITSATKSLGPAIRDTLEYVLKNNFTSLGGTSVVLGLKQGDYVGLPTDSDSWCFKRFTQKDYESVKNRIASGELLIDGRYAPDASCELSDHITLLFPS